MKKLTGASKVLVFDHNFRSSDSNPKIIANHKYAKNNAIAPFQMVHADYSKDSGPIRLE